MAFNFIFAFVIFFNAIVVAYSIFYVISLQKWRKKKPTVAKMFNNKLILYWLFSLTYGLFWPWFIFCYVMYGLITAGVLTNESWGYIYLTLSFIAYFITIIFVLWQNFIWSSLHVAISQQELIMFDSVIKLTYVIGIEPHRWRYFIKYKDKDNLTQYKSFVTKTLFNLLKGV